MPIVLRHAGALLADIGLKSRLAAAGGAGEQILIVPTVLRGSGLHLVAALIGVRALPILDRQARSVETHGV